MVYRASSRLCVPDLLYIASLGGTDVNISPEQKAERRKHRLNCVELWGALTGTQNKASPVSDHDGWEWLIKMGKQLHLLMHKKQIALTKNGSNGNDHNTAVRLSSLEQECCTALYVMLRQSCAALIVRFGWASVKDALVALQRLITSDTTTSGTRPTDTQIPKLQSTQTGIIYPAVYPVIYHAIYPVIINPVA